MTTDKLRKKGGDVTYRITNKKTGLFLSNLSGNVQCTVNRLSGQAWKIEQTENGETFLVNGDVYLQCDVTFDKETNEYRYQTHKDEADNEYITVSFKSLSAEDKKDVWKTVSCTWEVDVQGGDPFFSDIESQQRTGGWLSVKQGSMYAPATVVMYLRKPSDDHLYLWEFKKN